MDSIEEDKKMLNGSLIIMKRMYDSLRALDVNKAKASLKDLDSKTRELYLRKDGKDTRFFDIVAEQIICLGDTSYGHYSLFERVYSEPGVVITEERGRVPKQWRIEHNTPVIISDPVDRSSYLEKMIEENDGSCKTMGELFDNEKNKIGDSHARVESCNSSVTLLKDNMIKYSIILNLFTGEVFVAYERGVFTADINNIENEDQLTEKVEFKKDEGLDILFYTDKGKYEKNREGTHLRFFKLDASKKSPGGPNRFMYLLKQNEKDDDNNIKVIAHNGEKIQESLPNIAVAYFSKGSLAAYKLFCDRENHEHRAGKLLTPNLQNSLYNDGKMVNVGLKLEFLNNHDYPSEFRDTTIITPVANESAMTMMEGMVKREYAIRII